MYERTVFEQVAIGGTMAVSVHGEVSMDTAPAFKAKLLDVGAANEAFAVDLSDCPYFDSSGIGALIATYKALGSRRLNIVLPEDAFLRRLFRIAGIERLFTFFADREALAAAEPPKADESDEKPARRDY